MPYLPADAKDQIQSGEAQPCSPGELNFAITRLIQSYYANKRLTYTLCNDILGALEGAKQEFYRRVVAPYEDKKIKENGDVY